jgi:hypothetical protein
MNKQEQLLAFIKFSLKGNGTGGLLYGKPGFGKTHALFQALAEYGLGKNFLYATNYYTPLSFFELLRDNSDKIIVCDDAENILENKLSSNFLRSALWKNNGHRFITYSTSKKKTTFEFKGKIILIANYLPKRIAPIADRVPTYEYNLTREELLSIIERNLVNKEYKNLSFKDRKEIFEHIKNYKNNDSLSLRTFIKMADAMSFDRNNWRSLNF